MTNKRFWVSWWQMTSDYRPLTDPPSENVLGWWNSGSDPDGNTSICAVIEANKQEDVMPIILKNWQENDGEVGETRFCEEVADDWLPSNRFPITDDWVKDRLKTK